MAGYSSTPLVQKLGIKGGFRMATVGAPAHYLKLLGQLPEPLEILQKPTSAMDFIHYFSSSKADYEKRLPGMKKALAPSGMLWVSWPKAAAKVPTDLTENTVRSLALKNGLVDIKVCAVDETWSGLKLVIPIKDRK